MTDEMTIEAYLDQGGKLTSPGNVPARYRAELLKLMATFVDSELAGAAGFADVINLGPGIKERIAAARIVLEKTDHAERVLRIMGDFGVDTGRYVTHHPWAARLPREAPVGAARSEHDMRLAVFNYPLDGWTDAVVMNLIMGHAVLVQLADMEKISYQPLAEAIRALHPTERRHVELAAEGLLGLDEAGRRAAQESVAYWWPRVEGSFGGPSPAREEMLAGWGLRHSGAAEMRGQWERAAGEALAEAGLHAP